MFLWPITGVGWVCEPVSNCWCILSLMCVCCPDSWHRSVRLLILTRMCMVIIYQDIKFIFFVIQLHYYRLASSSRTGKRHAILIAPLTARGCPLSNRTTPALLRSQGTKVLGGSAGVVQSAGFPRDINGYQRCYNNPFAHWAMKGYSFFCFFMFF